jgi:hypothetical protein
VTAPMLLAADKPADIPLSLLMLGLGTLVFVLGVRSTRGKEGRNIVGDTPRYQTYFGATYAMIPGGLAFMLLGAAETIRGIIDGDKQAAWFGLLAYPAAVCMVLCFLYLIVYFWFGVPDWLRPPSQRGQPPPPTMREARAMRANQPSPPPEPPRQRPPPIPPDEYDPSWGRDDRH